MTLRPINAASIDPIYLQSEIKCLHQWHFPFGKVSLIKSKGCLEYVLEEDGKKIQGPIPTPPDADIEECSKFLISCELIVVDESVSFTLPVHRWKIEEGEVCLLQANDSLEYLLINREGVRIHRALFPLTDLDKKNLQKTIQNLKACQPLLKEGKVIFLSIYHSWNWNDHKVELLKDDELNFVIPDLDPYFGVPQQLLLKDHQLIWHVFNQKTKTTTFLSFEQTTLLYVDDEEVNCISNVKIKSQLSVIKEFKIEKLEVNTDCLEVPKNFFFTYPTFCSKFDSKIFIHHESYAITLVNTGKVNNMNPMTWYGHAGLVIEGVKNGTYFSKFTDLKADNGGTVRLEKRTVAYSEKSQTFHAPPVTVKRMIETIKREIKQQEKGEPIVRFSKGKVTSLLSRSEALLKWDGNSLSPTCHKVKTYDSYQDMVRNILECTPCVLDTLIWDDRDIEYSRKLRKILFTLGSGGNETAAARQIEKEIASEKKLLATKKVVEEQISQLLKSESQVIAEKTEPKNASIPYYSVLLIDKSRKHRWIESNNPGKRYHENNVKNDAYEELISHRVVLEEDNGKWVEIVEPHNCLSWLAVKVRPLGLYISEFSSDWKPSELFKQNEFNLDLSKFALAADFKNIIITPPVEIRRKALERDIRYLKELRRAMTHTKTIPERPQVTLKSLLPIPQKIDPDVLFWLASLHDTPGITLEICTYFKKISPISQAVLSCALQVAIATASVKEMEILVSYFEVQIVANPDDDTGATIIDYLLLLPQITEEGLLAFLGILRNRKINLCQTLMFKNQDFLKKILNNLARNKNYGAIIFMLCFLKPEGVRCPSDLTSLIT